jgi:hypothetical protein
MNAEDRQKSRVRGGTIGAAGRRRALEIAAEDEAERQLVEAGLLQDLGHEASSTERLAVEVIAAQVVRARRMRAQGRHQRAEMSERLVLRGLARLGVRQGQAKDPNDVLQQLFDEIAAEKEAAQ